MPAAYMTWKPITFPPLIENDLYNDYEIIYLKSSYSFDVIINMKRIFVSNILFRI